MDTLNWLQDWYLSQCDGEWEDSEGVKIESLDNPGWAVDISLVDTEWESECFEAIAVERSEHDWIHCKVEGGQFRGYGGPRNLQEILEVFRAWISKGRRG